MDERRLFWKLALGSMVAAGICTASFFAVVIVWHHKPASAESVAYNPTKDPFETEQITPEPLHTPFLYRESMPLLAYSASWGVKTDWRSSEKVHKGSYSLKVSYKDNQGGVSLEGEKIDATGYKGISLALYPTQEAAELYLELFDAKGKEIGKQSLCWYLSNGNCIKNKWQVVNIPFANLSSSSVKTVGGFAVESTQPGTLYLDDIELVATATPHTLWVKPLQSQSDESLFSLLYRKTIPTPLPFMIASTSSSTKMWNVFAGSLAQTLNSLDFTPPKNGGDGMVAYLGGRNWQDYKVDTTLDWGSIASFSILLRFKDDGNFTSCAFGEYGSGIQLYQVANGQSKLLAESPSLPTPDQDGWYHVHVGAKVVGNRVSCFLNNEEIIGANIPSMSATGTVGLEAWDSAALRTPHHILYFRVDSL